MYIVHVIEPGHVNNKNFLPHVRVVSFLCPGSEINDLIGTKS